MKITKAFLNQLVILTWEDPRGGGSREEIDKAPKGKAALAKWNEFGRIDDITDGVIRIRHSEAFESPGNKEPDEGVFSWIVEALITDCIILTEKPDAQEA